MTSWLVDTFQMEPGWARGIGFFIAVVIVLALISIFVWVLRRIAGGRSLGGRSRQPRVAIMDAAALDTRRRLILIRRDNVEHLLLVGGPSDVVVERNIVRGVPVSQAYPRQPLAEPQLGTAALDIDPEPVPVAPPPAPQREAAPVRTAAPRRPAAQQPAAPQPPLQPPLQPTAARAAAPQRVFGTSQPRAGDTPDTASPLKRAGASVAAAGAAVAGLARGGHATGSEAPRPEAPRPEAPRPEAPRAEPARAEAPRMEIPPRAPAPAATAPAQPAAAVPQPRREPPPPIRRNVTPPSSGPAANARTAFPNFGEAADKPATDKPATERSASPRGDLSGVTAGAALAGAASGGVPASGASAPAAAPAPVATPVAPVSAPAPAVEKASPDLGSLEDALLAELGQSRAGSPPAPAERSEPRAEFGSRPTPPPAPAPVPAVEAEPADAVEATDESSGADDGDTRPETATVAPAEKDVPEAAAGEKADAAPEAEKKAGAGPVTMDAIEEEMARLLSEIGGPRK
jgi:flagellar biogenesis protein FliO